MAGKKTVLDIVKEVDNLDLYKDILKSKRSVSGSAGYNLPPVVASMIPDTALMAEVIQKERITIPKLEKEVISEESPTAGGTYKGSVYYSNILPEDQGDLPWTKEAANIVEKASQYGAKKSDILAAQNYFTKIGYMHHSEVDGMPGPQLHGMISRWNKNAGQSKEAIFDAMETWKDNIFSRDKE